MKIITTSHGYERIRPLDARDSDKIPSPIQQSHSKTRKESDCILIIIACHGTPENATRRTACTIGGDFKPHKSHWATRGTAVSDCSSPSLGFYSLGVLSNHQTAT